MAMSSPSLNWPSTILSKKINVSFCHEAPRVINVLPSTKSAKSITDEIFNNESNCKRRLVLLGTGALTTSLFPANPIFAEGMPKNYEAFVDAEDGYSYYYPVDWIEFDFRGHDSAFKDRILQLQNVRVRFIPTEKKDIHDLGPMEQVMSDLVRYRYAAPGQVPEIMDMQERTVDGRNYYTVEYGLSNRNFAHNAFTTIAIGNGRYYTLTTGALERRWRRFRNMLKVIADSFKVMDISTA